MNVFEQGLQQYIGKERLKRIQEVRVGIAGAGGLGSNCAFNLVRSGFCNFKIVDFDIVEPTNLNRQFYFYDQIEMPKVTALKHNLLRINPDLSVDIVQQKITEGNVAGLFEDCDVVVEAFDIVTYKTLIVEAYFSSGKLLVSASGLGGWGNSDDIKVRRVHPRFYLVGDNISEVSEEVPPISPRVNIAAAKQADIILEYVINSKGDNTT